MIYANAVSAASRIAPHINPRPAELVEPAVVSYTNQASAMVTTSANWAVFVPTMQFYFHDLQFKPLEFFSSWPSTAIRLEEAKTARHLLEEFALLKDNWDGYKASAISAATRTHARNFIDMIEAALLPAPDISPLPSGTISFEWETANTHAYIEIGTTRYSGFIKTDQGPILIHGSADHLGQDDQNVVSLIQRYISAPTPSAAPTIELRTLVPQYDLLAL